MLVGKFEQHRKRDVEGRTILLALCGFIVRSSDSLAPCIRWRFVSTFCYSPVCVKFILKQDNFDFSLSSSFVGGGGAAEGFVFDTDM